VSSALLSALATAGATALVAWLACLADPARAWSFRPVAEDAPPPPSPPAWPSVRIVVPARDESAVLPETLPALLAQAYAGEWAVVLVDDRSVDGTAAVARALGAAAGTGAGRLAVVTGAPLPAGWAGKVWALAQGVETAGACDYVLLTDADIRHTPGSLARLVAESEADGLALNSRMALLRCVSAAERLLVPPFVLFFNLLYPMRRVNDPASRVAAAAGGCVLVRRDALVAAGGLVAIRGEVIDDVNLGRALKGPARRGAPGRPIRLQLSRSDVVSVRPYRTVGPIWRMVRRTAFTELRHSYALLAVTVAGLAVLFALPPALVPVGAVVAATGRPGWGATLAALGAAGWLATAAVAWRATRFFGLAPGWALALPLAGVLYGGMTLDSGRLHLLGRRRAW
jgi:hopene-associated glycosyltransferase HpnB